MHMKFVPLGLIASILVSVSARSLYSENSLASQNAVTGALKSSLAARSADSLVDASRINVGLDRTGYNILNGLLVAGNANNLDANVLSSGSGLGSGSGSGSGSHHGGGGHNSRPGKTKDIYMQLLSNI